MGVELSTFKMKQIGQCQLSQIAQYTCIQRMSPRSTGISSLLFVSKTDISITLEVLCNEILQLFTFFHISEKLTRELDAFGSWRLHRGLLRV